MNTTRILIFAKAPTPGRVKTRLIPALGAEGAARLAHAMLARTLAAAIDSAIGPVELCADPDPASPAWYPVLLPGGIDTSFQGEGDLGARMARAAARHLQAGESVILIGTDCVEMSAELLSRAACRLAACDALIHPAHDGGYALLGLRRFAPTLFAQIPWSTDAVARLTIERIRALGWQLDVAEPLNDVDEVDDLALLRDMDLKLVE